MNKYLRKGGKIILFLYIAQAAIGIAVGVWIGMSYDPAEIERIISCVAH